MIQVETVGGVLEDVFTLQKVVGEMPNLSSGLPVRG
jgi:hypothetical protein